MCPPVTSEPGVPNLAKEVEGCRLRMQVFATMFPLIDLIEVAPTNIELDSFPQECAIVARSAL